MNFKNFFLIFIYVLFKNKIVLLNSPLQFINFIEFINFKKKNDSKYNYKYVFLGYLNNKEINIIVNINKKINSNKYKIIPFKKNINVFLLHFFIKIRKFFLNNYNQIIFGDYNYYLFREFYKISNSRIMLDDGTNSLEFEKLFKLDRSNLIIFTLFNKKIYHNKKIIENKFLYLKNFLKKKNKKKSIAEGYFIGSPFVETGILTRDQYYFFIKNIINRNKDINFIYVPNPRELSENYNKYNFKKILKSNYNFELFLINSDFYPKVIVGASSTLFLTIKSIFDDQLDLKSYSFIVKSKKKAERYVECYGRLKLINNYFRINNIFNKKIIINI
jgi:hypothetical protein